MAKETFEFQAQTRELLGLMINSIYTNKEIFLRELISNASDAIDKLHFASLTNRDLVADGENYEIYLKPDKENKTLTVCDNGIGMNREELVENIGTIAKSGTKAFLEQIKKAKEENADLSEKELIGQFGVGFYAAFMVAKSVAIVTKKAGEQQAYRWESTADGNYTIEETEKDGRGTDIIISLKDEFVGGDGDQDFTDNYNLKTLVKKYSDYVRYPIKLDYEVEETPKDDEGKEIEGAEKVKRIDTRTLNSMKPLWTKNKSDITAEEYNEFFKSQFHEWENPMEIFHTKIEGALEYTALLAIPAKAPFNLYHSDYEPGIALYSRHVFIMDKCKDLLPDYLRFMKGLVDSPDLQLNISRELLQQSRELKTIGKALEKDILKSLERKLKNKREDYEKFWNEYGKSIKFGIYNARFSGEGLTDKLKDLLLYVSSKEGKLVSLKEYTERMPESQTDIYYASAKDKEAVEKLPQMELLKEKGIEVLYMFDQVDEFAIEALHEYNGKHFRSVSKGDLNLSDAESEQVKKDNEEIAKESGDLMKDIKEVLGAKVSEVKLSNRLKSGAVCLVAAEEGPSLAMEQTFAAMEGNGTPNFFKAQRILEINPHHELFNRLKSLHAAGGKDGEDFKDYCDLLYAQALLLEGIVPDDPADFAAKLAKLMAR